MIFYTRAEKATQEADHEISSVVSNDTHYNTANVTVVMRSRMRTTPKYTYKYAQYQMFIIT